MPSASASQVAVSHACSATTPWTPLGRIVGCRVHRFDGTYVGEWFRDMVVKRPPARPRLIPAAGPPPPRPPVSASYNLRAVVDYGYPDCFGLLREGAYSQAAE